MNEIQITFSKSNPGKRQPLHATTNEIYTLCNIRITRSWDYGTDLTIRDVQCKRYNLILKKWEWIF